MLAMQISIVLTQVVNIVYASHDHIVKYIVKGRSGQDTKAKKSCSCEPHNKAENLPKFMIFNQIIIIFIINVYYNELNSGIK